MLKDKDKLLKPDEKLVARKKHGMTNDYLIGKLKGLCEAEENGKPLWQIQEGGVKEANKVFGLHAAEKHEHTQTINFVSNVPEPDMPKEEETPMGGGTDSIHFDKAGKKTEQPEKDHK